MITTMNKRCEELTPSMMLLDFEEKNPLQNTENNNTNNNNIEENADNLNNFNTKHF